MDKRPHNASTGRRLRCAPLVLALTLSGYAGQLSAMSHTTPVGELADLSLEELSNIRVTSVSRTEEDLQGAAAAISVVTSEDIERSGATSIPDALRMVPGIHVARQNASTWAVSSRGFSDANSRNLLVQSDTRSIYTPLVSGVFWDAQDYLMEDIDTIEVVRGPGASLWGSNAVNGVISITTKSAEATQGSYAEALAGTEERGVAARYGGKSEGDVYYRVFAKHTEHDASYAPDAQSSDNWHLSHLGFRTDWETSPDDRFTVQGDVYQGKIGQIIPSIRIIGRPGPEGDLEVDINGGNILGRWQHRISGRADLQLRAYYDRTYRDDPSFKDSLDTVDIDFQHRVELGQRHELLWGLNYRHTENRNEGKGLFAVVPTSSSDDLVSFFIQDQILLREGLMLTLGTKLEHNDFSGFEMQPNVRLAWEPALGHTIWTSVARAVRVPTRYERDIRVDATDPEADTVVRLVGNEDFKAEETIAYEAGYRWQATDKLSLDLAVFRNRYRNLASLEFGEPFSEDGRTIMPIQAENLGRGRSHGFESLISYAPQPFWRITATYSYLNMHLDSTGADLNRGALLEGATPSHQAGIRSSFDWRAYEFDLQLRHSSDVESLPASVSGEGVPGYTEMDLRIARAIDDKVELSLVGRNLLASYHPEFGTEQARGEAERRLFAKIAVRF